MFNFGSKIKLTADILEEIEDILIMSDMGVKLAAQFTNFLSKTKFGNDITDYDIKTALRSYIIAKYTIDHSFHYHNSLPNTILLCGSNGAGKTTTIAKLAHIFNQQNKKVLLVAGDTFRAGAVQQLDKWAQELNIHLLPNENTTSIAALAYRGYQVGLEEKYDIVLIDSAGRVHNNTNLMEELKKVSTSLHKLNPELPHESIMILDGTIGQSAIVQLENYQRYTKITGIIVTKLDGSAKAGFILQIIDKFNIPIYFLGIGESKLDIVPFILEDFLTGLLEI